MKCGVKMFAHEAWGFCVACGVYCHSRCAPNFHLQCNSAVVPEEPEPDSTMFGNDLTAQVQIEGTPVPSIVTKCIAAVEEHGTSF
jgi:hypothetical protein